MIEKKRREAKLYTYARFKPQGKGRYGPYGMYVSVAFSWSLQVKKIRRRKRTCIRRTSVACKE